MRWVNHRKVKAPITSIIHLLYLSHTEKKRGASSCRSFHNVKAFALPCSSKRATRISPTRCIYTQWHSLTIGYNCGCTVINEAYICIHLTRGISRCFVFNEQFEVAKFLHCQNQSVQKTPFSVCSSLPIGKWSHEATMHLPQPFCAMMSLGRVFFADVTPCNWWCRWGTRNAVLFSDTTISSYKGISK